MTLGEDDSYEILVAMEAARELQDVDARREVANRLVEKLNRDVRAEVAYNTQQQVARLDAVRYLLAKRLAVLLASSVLIVLFIGLCFYGTVFVAPLAGAHHDPAYYWLEALPMGVFLVFAIIVMTAICDDPK